MATTPSQKTTSDESTTDRHGDLAFRDADGRAHYWRIATQTVTVVASDGTVSHELALPVRADDGTVVRTLGDWRDYVAARTTIVEDRVVSNTDDWLSAALEDL